jgi:predicted O-methyltransferase YrrM
VTLRIRVDGRTVTADVAAKALRKAKATIAQAGADGVAVLVQGRLAIDNALLEAGLVVQDAEERDVAAQLRLM